MTGEGGGGGRVSWFGTQDVSERVSKEECRGRMGGVGCRENVPVLSPVTRTDVWGGEVEDWRIGA